MGKKNLLVMAASIFLATANAPTATAQEVGGVEISTTSILPITGVTQLQIYLQTLTELMEL